MVLCTSSTLSWSCSSSLSLSITAHKLVHYLAFSLFKRMGFALFHCSLHGSKFFVWYYHKLQCTQDWYWAFVWKYLDGSIISTGYAPVVPWRLFDSKYIGSAKFHCYQMLFAIRLYIGRLIWSVIGYLHLDRNRKFEAYIVKTNHWIYFGSW